MRPWTRTGRGIWRSGLRAEALALLSVPREERAPDPLGRFGRGEGLLDVKERGEQDARDRLSIFLCASFLASRAAVSDQGPPILVGGRVSETGPGLSELSALAQVRRAGLLPIRFQPQWQPRRSTGRSDQTGVVPNTRGTPESASASRARGSRDPGRRRRSRPTLTTPRESVPRRTGRVRHRTVFHGCQGLFSEAVKCCSRRLLPVQTSNEISRSGQDLHTIRRRR